MARLFDLPCANLACDIVYREDFSSIASQLQDYEVLEDHLRDSKFNPHASSYIIVRSKAARGVVYLVFRGTQDLSDMIADFNCQPREIDDAEPSFFVHGGIYETSKQSMKTILKCLNEESKKEAITDLVFTGHSLGGACAIAARLVTLEKKSQGLQFAPTCHIITFGAPLLFSSGASLDSNVTGEEAWNTHLTQVSRLFENPFLQTIQKESYSFVNECDLVPRILGRKRERNPESGKSTWEQFLEENSFLGLSTASVELLPGASAGAAGVAGTGAIVLSPAPAMALLSAIFIPIVALPALALCIPMLATTKALPPVDEGGRKRPSDLEVKCEQFAFHAISWAVLASKGNRILESEQLSGYFPIGTFAFLHGWGAPQVVAGAEETIRGLDVPHGMSVQRCIASHGTIHYLSKLRFLHAPPPSLPPPAADAGGGAVAAASVPLAPAAAAEVEAV